MLNDAPDGKLRDLQQTSKKMALTSLNLSSYLVVVRGGGDLATGVIYRLYRAKFTVVALELAHPLVVRRRVAAASAILDGGIEIEGMPAQKAANVDEALKLADAGIVPVLVSPQMPAALQPDIIIDARMAKRNIDTHLGQAPLVIALGPGFEAGVDCHAVVETMRGHRLGRVIWHGTAAPNSGTPGIVAGKGVERVLRAPNAGIVRWQLDIGDRVAKGQPLGNVGDMTIVAPFDGVARGLIAEGTMAQPRQKIGDIDARGDREACFTISDKALAIGGGALEAILTVLAGN